MTFKECVDECLKDRELIAEFDRLTGSNLSLKGSNLDVQIDLASGRYPLELRKFFQFVHDVVWTRV